MIFLLCLGTDPLPKKLLTESVAGVTFQLRSHLIYIEVRIMAEIEAGRIEKILWDDFEIAVKEKNHALEEFNLVIEDTPSGLPHPDGVQRIKACSRRYSEARHHMILALERLNNFRNNGIVPDDLRRKPPQSEACVATPKDEPKTESRGGGQLSPSRFNP